MVISFLRYPKLAQIASDAANVRDIQELCISCILCIFVYSRPPFLHILNAFQHGNIVFKVPKIGSDFADFDFGFKNDRF